MPNRICRLACTLPIAAACAAHASPTTIEVSGTVIDDGLFQTLPVGTPWTLTLTLSSEIGTPIDEGQTYTGSARLEAPGYIAHDPTTELRVLTTSGGTISFRMDGADATLPPLQYQNSPATADPVEVTLTLINTAGGPVLFDGSIPPSVEISDFEAAQLYVRVPLNLSPIGSAEAMVIDLGCVADFADPVGELNFFDLTAFIASFGAQQPSADLAPPFGSFDFFDVSTYLQLFNAGCP